MISAPSFMRAFLRNNTHMIGTESVEFLFEKWCMYLCRVLQTSWPRQWPAYSAWVAHQNLYPGKETTEFGDLGRFVSEVTFLACINFLISTQFQVDGKDSTLCRWKKSEHNGGYKVVGNMLWPVDELFLEWHLNSDTVLTLLEL